MKRILAVSILSIYIFSCNTKTAPENNFKKAITLIEDTLHLSKNLKVINIYKDQLTIYNHYIETEDAVKLQHDLKALYTKFLGPWGSHGCFTWSEQQFVEFNKNNVFNNYAAIKERVRHLIEQKADAVFSNIFLEVSAYSGHSISGKYYVYFMPQEMQGFDMGGCDINTMQVNLSNENLTIDGIAKVFPHELNHQIYEFSSVDDEHYGTVLWGIIDEGFAVYFERKFNNASLLSSLLFTDKAYSWCLAHEKEIFYKAKPLFLSTKMEDENRLRGNRGKYLIKGAPNRLNYFLGYRIVEQYINVYGKDSWRDIYTTPVMELLVKSNYEELLEKVDKNR